MIMMAASFYKHLLENTLVSPLFSSVMLELMHRRVYLNKAFWRKFP